MVSALLRHGLAPQGKQVPQLCRRKLGDPALAGADDALGQRQLALDQRVDSLLHGAGADKLVEVDVPLLPDPEGAVRRLVLDRRVPPSNHTEDVTSKRLA